MSKKKESKEHIFSDEETAALVKLGDVLRPIVDRLVIEGKAKIVNGTIIFLVSLKNRNV
jgi:hypothetical protein